MATKVLKTTVAPTIVDLLPSFKRTLEAENKSPRTIKTYLESVNLLIAFIEGKGMPLALASIRREHIESFIVDVLDRWKPSTASVRYRSLQAFWKWAVGEGEVQDSPMARMRPPSIPETPVPVLSEGDLVNLLKACEGRDFEARRDMAMLRLFIDTGMRRSELTGMSVEDVDFEINVANVTGKGARPRACPFGRKTALALDRYLRSRTQQRLAGLPELWLGHAGPMTDSGIAQAIKRRARAADIPGVNLHRFRHTFAHQWLVAGGNEGDLLRLAGWRSRQMVGRYGASAADERARLSHQKLGLGDRI